MKVTLENCIDLTNHIETFYQHIEYAREGWGGEAADLGMSDKDWVLKCLPHGDGYMYYLVSLKGETIHPTYGPLMKEITIDNVDRFGHIEDIWPC